MNKINVKVVDRFFPIRNQITIDAFRNSLRFLYSSKITSADNFTKKHKALRTCSYLFENNLEILSSSHTVIDGWDYQTVSIPQVPLFANNMMYQNQWNHVTSMEYIQKFLADMEKYQKVFFFSHLRIKLLFFFKSAKVEQNIRDVNRLKSMYILYFQSFAKGQELVIQLLLA